jgi:hypothetical protein
MNKPQTTPASTPAASPMTRRHLVAGAGVAGAAAAAATLLPVAPASAPVVAAQAVAEPAADGYRLTEHVQRYYQTARV